MIKILVCGDRWWNDRERMRKKLSQVGVGGPNVAFLIHGGAKGADKMSENVAVEDLGLPKNRVIEFAAEWDMFHKAAGPIRNRKMFKESDPDLILAFHDHPERSKGTVDMVKVAEAANKSVWKSWEDPEYAPC